MPVTRLYLRFALPSLALLAALMLLIRAQPYDDSIPRRLLLSNDCPAPCFMGITPGLTTYDGVSAILEGHEWVGRVVRQNAYSLAFTWSGFQPEPIHPRSIGLIEFDPDQGRVKLFIVQTTIPVGEVYLLAGQPLATGSGMANIEGTQSFVLACFEDFWVSTVVACPVSYPRLWSAPARVGFGSQCFLRDSVGVHVYC